MFQGYASPNKESGVDATAPTVETAAKTTETANPTRSSTNSTASATFPAAILTAAAQGLSVPPVPTALPPTTTSIPSPATAGGRDAGEQSGVQGRLRRAYGPAYRSCPRWPAAPASAGSARRSGTRTAARRRARAASRWAVTGCPRCARARDGCAFSLPSTLHVYSTYAVCLLSRAEIFYGQMRPGRLADR